MFLKLFTNVNTNLLIFFFRGGASTISGTSDAESVADGVRPRSLKDSLLLFSIPTAQFQEES